MRTVRVEQVGLSIKDNPYQSGVGETITSSADLFGQASPSIMFPLMSRLGLKYFTRAPEEIYTDWSMKLRTAFPFIKWLAPKTMKFRQVFENSAPALSSDPVIWCANHSFKDDVAATVVAARHSYIFFGSLPIFFNTFDGFGAWLNGAVLCNRKLRTSRHHAYLAASYILKKGSDLIVFPEGVWNNTPEKIILNLWPGAVRLAQEKGIKIVPVVHYLREPHQKYRENVIHTYYGEPIAMSGLSEKEGITFLRETMASMYYELMDKYGHSTRAEQLSGYESADEAWEAYQKVHNALKYYDVEIESSADYRPKCITWPADVWRSVAEIKELHLGNIFHVCYAQTLFRQEERRDFQRRCCVNDEETSIQ